MGPEAIVINGIMGALQKLFHPKGPRLMGPEFGPNQGGPTLYP